MERSASSTARPAFNRVCAVMQVTDIELQAGEQINNINIGDSACWLVEPAVTGAGVAEVQHIVIKPMDGA